MDIHVENGMDSRVVEVDVDGTLETMAVKVAKEFDLDVKTFELWKGDECVRHARDSDLDTAISSTTLAGGDVVVLRMTERHAARKKLEDFGLPTGPDATASFVRSDTPMTEEEVEHLKLIILAEEVNPIQQLIDAGHRTHSQTKLRRMCELGPALVNRADASGSYPLHHLCTTGPARTSEAKVHPLVRILVENGADPDVVDDAGDTPLHLATRSLHSRTVCTLLSAGANANALDGRGESALSLAVRLRNRHSVLHLTIDGLLEHGADVHVRDTRQLTPLLTILQLGEKFNAADRHIAQRLLVAGARGDVVDGEGRTATMLAASGFFPGEVMSLILKAGGDALQVNDKGESPLHVVCVPSTAKVLVEAGADPNGENKEGNTPLVAAILASRFDAAQALLEAGADPYHKNAAGLSPLELVRRAPKESVWPPSATPECDAHLNPKKLVPLALSSMMKGKARQADARRCAAALLANVA
eukprot:Rhum_TRINITY_DN14645_c2_g1::Rhum_TRINITY_DN14645_c2_g1_i1::g.102857::m.102857